MSQDRSVVRTDLHRSFVYPAPDVARRAFAGSAAAGRGLCPAAAPRRPLRRPSRPRPPSRPLPAATSRAGRCRRPRPPRPLPPARRAAKPRPRPPPAAAAAKPLPARSRCCSGRRPPSSTRTSRRAPRTTSRPALHRAADDGGQRRQVRAGAGRRGAEHARTAASRADGKSVTYKLKPGVKWADGQPFIGRRRRLHLRVRHQQGVSARSRSAPTRRSTRWRRSTRTPSRSPSRSRPAAGIVPFVGYTGMIIPKHIMKDYVGREVPRRADQHQAGRHRPVHGRGLQPRRPGDLQGEPELPRGRASSSSTGSR